MNINILTNIDNFERMSRASIQESSFIAYSDGEDTFAIKKNRIDGVTGEKFAEEVVRSYISEIADATSEIK